VIVTKSNSIAIASAIGHWSISLLWRSGGSNLLVRDYCPHSLKHPNAPSVVDVFETFRTQRHWDEAETRASLDILNRVLTEQVLLLSAIEAEQSGQDEPGDNG